MTPEEARIIILGAVGMEPNNGHALAVAWELGQKICQAVEVLAPEVK